MSIHSFRGVHHSTGMNFSDPAGLGVPFTPFTPSTPYPPDSFRRRFGIEKKEKVEKLTADKVVSSFISGMVQPFVEMVKHPIKTLAAAAAIGIAMKRVPVIGKYLAMAGLAIGGLQFFTGMGKAATGIMDGNTEEAKAGFKSMGSGTTGILFSRFGSKKADKLVKSAEEQAKLATASGTGGAAGTTTGTTASTGASATTSSNTSILGKLKSRLDSLFSNAKKNKPEDVLDFAKQELPQGVKTGFAYQVPFATYYGNSITTKEATGEAVQETSKATNPSRAYGLDMADEIYKGNYDFKTEE